MMGTLERPPPPWEIGRPQRWVVRIGPSLEGPVLDLGSGTGENALHLAGLGLKVRGVDFLETAVREARRRAKERSIHRSARFDVADARDLRTRPRQFGTVLDSGLFHNLVPADRDQVIRAAHRALRPGGSYVLLCFSDLEDSRIGPRFRIQKSQIRSAFETGWVVKSIRAARFETRVHPRGARAWLALLQRTA